MTLFLSSLVFCSAAQELEISEFVASNESGLQDEDGEFSDWIEIHNTGSDDSVDLAGLYLTDNDQELNQWAFPSIMLGPNEYLVVFASGKDRKTAGRELHTNFKLSADGEYLALTTGATALFDYGPAYPPQDADRSYGIDANGGRGYFSTPTPGAANPINGPPVVGAVSVDVDRGFYSSSFDLTLTTETADAEIRYTTNGSKPTELTGLVYTAPITISTTTVVRASAFLDGGSGPISTHSYIFLNDVMQQP